MFGGKKTLDDLKKVSFWLDCMIHLTLHFHGKQLWVNSVGALLKQDHVLANSIVELSVIGRYLTTHHKNYERNVPTKYKGTQESVKSGERIGIK